MLCFPYNFQPAEILSLPLKYFKKLLQNCTAFHTFSFVYFQILLGNHFPFNFFLNPSFSKSLCFSISFICLN